MKVLILSVNNGQGHNSCAAALGTAYERHGCLCVIWDALSFVSEDISRLVSNCHVKIYRYIPRSNDIGYRLSEKHPGAVFKKGSPVYGLLRNGAKKLAARIDEEGFDAVIACHVFAAVMLTQAKELCKKEFKSAHVSTDYTCSPGVAQSNMDFYFIPNEALRDEFAAAGVPEERIVSSGLPVGEKFFYPADRTRAREALRVRPGESHLMVMCGSMGGGPIYALSSELSGLAGENVRISIICGTNGNLKKKLDKKFGGDERFRIYGYVGNIAAFMDSADLFLTKPGGLSTSEAAVKGLPMVFVNSVAGCEDHNFNFFINAGGAVSAKKNRDIAALCISLLSNEERLKGMSGALRKCIPGNPAENIFEAMSL